MESIKEFESSLVEAFKELRLAGASVKVSKNKIKFINKKGVVGQIYLQHVKKADGYYAGIEVYSCDAMDFCLEQKPPYASRLLNNSFFSQSSLSEVDKRFGDEFGGIIRTPSLKDVSSVVEKVKGRLAEFYLPVAQHCISSSIELIDDILSAPDDYAYPFLSALYVAHMHRLAFNSPEFQRVVNRKKILGNREFDLELAKRLLSIEYSVIDHD